MKLQELKNKKILVLGYGREGKDTYSALKKLVLKSNIHIADKARNKNYLRNISKYDVVIKTPGIPWHIVKHKKVTSQTEIFLDNCPGTIIGVTGTKGKGTTCSMIYHILKKNGYKVKLIGNIGNPVFNILLNAKKDEYFVYEMSSHQLKGIKKSPHIAVFLDLYSAHLDFFNTFNIYRKAKENITLYQDKNDYFIYNSSFKELRDLAKRTKAKKIKLKNKADYNQLNLSAAIQVAKILKVPYIEAMKTYKPLPHRMELIKRKGIKFYNDSLATIPEATMLGIKKMQPDTLIIGGTDIKGADFTGVAKAMKNIKTIIFLYGGRKPETGKKIWELLGKPEAFFTKSMSQAVKLAYKHSKGICLLSPGSPSFHLFKDYAQRGDLFKKYVKLYGKKA